MRHHQRKSDQFELFGPSNQTNTLTIPEWQNLPAQTRQKITALLAQLLVEHNQQQASERAAEDLDSARIGEDGDV